MTTCNSGPSAPPDHNKDYYGQQEGGYPPPPQQPYPGTGYPNAPPPMYPGGMPPAGYPPGSKAPYGKQGGPYGGDPYGQPVEETRLSNKADTYGTSHSEDPEVKGFSFSEESIRKGFIRKVYSILTVQLLLTIAIISLFLFHTGTQIFVLTNPWLCIVAFIGLWVSIIVLARYVEVRRKAPANYILLAVFTLAESYVLAMISLQYDSDEVLMAVSITTVICFGLTLFAFQTKWDFTPYRGILFVSLIILTIFGFVACFMVLTGYGNKVVHLMYASFCVLLFSIYLVYDTQMMMGGKHKYSTSPEEYIFAVLNLYVDIVNVFAHILNIIGTLRG